MTHTATLAAAFWRELFTVNGAESILPYMITAVALGAILAGGYLTFCRAFSARILKKLLDAGATHADAAVTLGEIGLADKKPWSYLARFLLSSPACAVYKNASNDILDARTYEEYAIKKPKKGGPTDAAASDGDDAGHAKTHTDTKAPKIKLELTENTRFYILPDRLYYAETLGIKFSADDWMSLVYTTVATGFLWFLILHFLDNIVTLFS